MKLTRIIVHNVLGLADIDATLDGHNLWLVGGKNRSGKTSALKAITMAICGKRGCDYPDEPIRQGTKNGWVKLSTDNGLTIERKFSRKKDGGTTDTVRVVDAYGETQAEPQKLLNKLYQSRGFDPLAFAKLSSRDRLSKLKDMVSIDTSDLDSKREDIYQDRTLANRELKAAESKFSGLSRPADDTPEFTVDVSELTDEISAIQKQNNFLSEVERSLKSQKLESNRHEHRIEVSLEAIQKLNAQMEELESQLVDREKKAAESDKKKCEIEIQLKTMNRLDDSPQRESIRNAESINVAVLEKREYLKLEKDISDLETRTDGLSLDIESIDEKKVKMFEDAEWPVEGLSYDENGVRFNDRPFDQASYSESVDVSIEMGMAMNPELKLLIIEHGESIDNETFARIEEKAKESDYQFLVEYMTIDKEAESKCQIVLEEGIVKT